MNLETAGAETPAGGETASAEATTVETSEATTGQQSEAESKGAASATDATGEQTGDDAAAAEPKKKHWAHERIDELTRQRREAERAAEYWKARATQSVDPDSLEYEDGIAERVSQRHRQEQAETAKATADQLAAEAFSYRETVAREKFADYDAVTRNPNVKITNDMASVIYDSERGPELAYHLGKNPAEAARIAAMTPTRQAVEMGKLEVALSAPRPAPRVPAAPVKPVSGIASGGVRDPGSMSMSEYVAARKAGQI